MIVSVPAEAVARRDGKPVVFEVIEGRAKLRGVVAGGGAAGPHGGDAGAVRAETLVARPPETLKDGDAVRVES